MNRPSVGMLVYRNRVMRAARQKPWPSTSLAATAALRENMTLFIFTVSDIDLDTMQIRGWFYNGRKWTTGLFPPPDVLHISRRVYAKHRAVVRKLTKRCLLINTKNVLGKGAVYFALKSYPAISRIMPETIRYNGPDDLRRFLDIHPSVLAKREKGLGGERMSRVRKTGTNAYVWEHSVSGEKLKDLTLPALADRVERNAGDAFVLQQELNLLEVDQRRHFIRMLMCKDGNGEWQVACPYLLIGSKNQFAVNRHTGATQFPLDAGLDELRLPASIRDTLRDEIIAASTMLVEAIDKELGPMGVIGLDLSIDADYKLWLLEANARPNKNNLPFPEFETRLKPFLYMLQYAQHLYKSRTEA